MDTNIIIARNETPAECLRVLRKFSVILTSVSRISIVESQLRMTFGRFQDILVLFGFFPVIFASSNISTDSVSNVSKQNYANLSSFECSFATEDSYGKEQIKKFIVEEKELIFIHLSLQNFSNIFPLKSGATMYKMLDIVRIAGGFGENLLHLHPQFEQLSIGTLMYGVEHVDIRMKPISSVCFFNSTEDEIHKKLLTFAAKEFHLLDNSSSFPGICSMKVKDFGGCAEFYYNCCFRNQNVLFECRSIEKTFWINTLFVVMTITYIIAFLYSPLLIPTTWYKTTVSSSFTYRPQNMGIILKKDTNGQVSLHYNDVKHMPLFKRRMVNIVNNPSNVYLKINYVKINLQDMKSSFARFGPAGMLHSVKDNDEIKDCCNAKCCPCYKTFWTWQTCLKSTIQLVFIFCLLIPLFLRLLFFYAYEEAERNDREHFANQLNLEYPHMFKWNLTYSLKPDHSFFILSYALIIFAIQKKLYIKDVLDKIGIDETSNSIYNLSQNGLNYVLRPFKVCGIFGVLICPIYLTLIIPYIIFRYILPSIPLLSTSFLLLCVFLEEIYKYGNQCVTKKPITKTKGLKYFGLLICYMLCLLSIVTTLILCFEVIVFILQILMYVAIGVVLNASHVLTYITFAGMLIFYAYNSIRHVLNKYEIFRQTVLKHIILKLNESIRGFKQCAIDLNLDAHSDAKHQPNKNRATLPKSVEPSDETNQSDETNSLLPDDRDPQHELVGDTQWKFFPSQTIVVKENKIILSSPKPLVFFDDQGKPLVNDDVFFRMCQMNVPGAPGSLWGNYKRAFINFSIIVLFLMLVATIILAFGQSQGVTGTYQALATLGGGLIPLLLRKYLFKSQDLSDCGTEPFLFWEEMNQNFQCFSTHFQIQDIEGDIQSTPKNYCSRINVRFPADLDCDSFIFNELNRMPGEQLYYFRGGPIQRLFFGTRHFSPSPWLTSDETEVAIQN